jgi:signal transduction histidine kinase
LKYGGGFITRRNQLQWAVLLAVAVLLPTVSLLWFMSRVIANERLVVQQKLAALYQDKLDSATAATKSICAARLASIDKIQPSANPYATFRRLVLEENFQGAVVWDKDGAVVYPQSADPAESGAPSDSPLADAWQEEFAKGEYAEAAQLYGRASTDADPHVAVSALVGQSRCLARLNRPEEAVAACQKAAFTALPDHPDPALLLAVENARLYLLSLLKEPGRSPSEAEIFHRTVTALGNDLYNPAGDHALLPANQNLFIAKKVLAALENSSIPADAPLRDKLTRLAAAEDLSLSAVESSRPSATQFDSFFQIGPAPQRVYALRHRTQFSTVLVLLSETGIASFLAGYQDAFARSESACRILDDSGQLVAGIARPAGKPFATADLPGAFPGWKAELYFQGGDVFEKAARRQIAVYVWTAVLVILLMLIAGAFATQAVGKQIRLNSMKNNFIATVSHELKTPLASMRVLVDTLLEGRVRDQAQVTEYLRLTAKENERLSRMIDNFLTFSRMERNKVAFALVEARPAAIAQDAVESVKTKFAAQDCRLSVEIAEHLPEIHADHDAMVTVLVNLLDNACKYTTDDKQISLKIFPAAGSVCFAVSDNGIGLARRHLRRIFDRFYQVDSSLARKAEGCGLGLSIVKFIVDAHRGKIAVESKPGRGSTFTVSLPVNGRNGNGKTHQPQE